ncbi:MAG: hypothetical protein ABIN58_13525, partial [candidate division WOR-3 bacterium]
SAVPAARVEADRGCTAHRQTLLLPRPAQSHALSMSKGESKDGPRAARRGYSLLSSPPAADRRSIRRLYYLPGHVTSARRFSSFQASSPCAINQIPSSADLAA